MVSELNATETLQTDFISNVSHEFKTPISAIEGYASLLQEHQQSPEEQAEYIDKILFNTRRLSALAGNILLLSKLDSQSIHPQRSRFRLDEQVRRAFWPLSASGRKRTSTSTSTSTPSISQATKDYSSTCGRISSTTPSSSARAAA